MLANIILISIVLFQVAFLGFLLLLILYFSSALFVWPPSIPTDRRSRRYMIEFIKNKYPANAAVKMVDLGSGYGHLVRDMVKDFPSAEITGVELLRLPYSYSKFIFRRNPRVKIVREDLYSHNISGYDVVVFFLRKDHKVDWKVKNEIKQGAVVISNNFPLKDHEPQQVREFSDIFSRRSVYFYQF